MSWYNMDHRLLLLFVHTVAIMSKGTLGNSLQEKLLSTSSHTCMSKFLTYEVTSLSHYYKSLYRCWFQLWESCVTFQSLKPFHTFHMSTTAPCYGVELSPVKARKFLHRIRVAPAYKILLQVTEFRLQRSIDGCHYHAVWVNFHNELFTIL